MTDWTVQLEFEEGTSSKFWRARVEGKTLYVNYGKIGTNGQTQVKELGDPSAARAEYDKLVRDKRKKGYQDSAGAARDPGEPEDPGEGDDDDEDGDDAPPPPLKKAAAKAPPAAKPAPPASAPGHRLVLEAGQRKASATLYLDGKTLRMDSSETYASPDAAARAFERLKKMLGGEGYKPAS